MEKEIIVAGDIVTINYTGHNSCVSIVGFQDDPGEPDESNLKFPLCELRHQKELLYAPTGTFRKDVETGQYNLFLSFATVQCAPEQWENVKVATDEMLDLWDEFLQMQATQQSPDTKT